MAQNNANMRAAIKKNGNAVSGNFSMKQTKTQGSRPYISVPVGTVTFPSKTTVIQRKRLNTGSYNGKPQFETYVLACGNKVSYGQGKTVQNWYVGKKTYYGGKPGVIEYLYNGTSEAAARHRFAEIPYHKLWIKVIDRNHIPSGLSAQYVEEEHYTNSQGNTQTTYWATKTSDGKFASVVREIVQQKQFRQQRRQGGLSQQTRLPL